MRKSISLLALVSLILSALTMGCAPAVQRVAFEPRGYPSYAPAMGVDMTISSTVANNTSPNTTNSH